MDNLDALAMQADGLDAEIAAAAPGAIIAQQEEAAALDQGTNNGKALRLMLGLGVPLLGKLYPCIVEIYTEEAQEQVADSLGPVLTKYGVDLGDLGGAYREEIAAAIVCVPLALATVAGMRADIAARAAQAPKGITLTHGGRPDAPVAPDAPVVLG